MAPKTTVFNYELLYPRDSINFCILDLYQHLFYW